MYQNSANADLVKIVPEDSKFSSLNIVTDYVFEINIYAYEILKNWNIYAYISINTQKFCHL